MPYYVLLSIHLGYHKMDVPEYGSLRQDIPFENIVIHPEVDAALIRTAREIKFNDYIQPVHLPRPGITFGTYWATVSGWGVSEGGLKAELRSAAGKLLTPSQCEQFVGWDSYGPGLICMVNNGGSSCSVSEMEFSIN
jgi:Trypsin